MSTTSRAVKETVFRLDYDDFEKMVKEEWPAWAPNPKTSKYDDGWSYPADEECSNDTARTYNVDAKPADKYDLEDLDKFATRSNPSQMYMSGRLLDEMCRRGILEPGKYVVEVSY